MNPPFPVNGSPYTHSHPPPGAYHSPGPHNGVAHAPPPPYGYHPMQHYPSHQYHPYPNYPPYPTMGYSPPPPPPQAHPPPQHPTPPEQSASSPAPSVSATTKRKRKGTDSTKGKADRTSDTEESGKCICAMFLDVVQLTVFIFQPLIHTRSAPRPNVPVTVVARGKSGQDSPKAHLFSV